jgi:hypothetical protein
VGEDLSLYKNQLVSLPESFGALTVGGDLVLKITDHLIGPAHAEASGLHFPTVKGKVRK